MATTNPTDPNKIRLTGENSFIRLTEDSGDAETTRASHWRVLWSPGGPGHVLFPVSYTHLTLPTILLV